MKINPNSAVTNQVITERKTQHLSAGGSAAPKLGTVDRATLSTSLPTVSNLVSQAMQTPTVRQDKVNALRDAVSSGTYAVNSHTIATALVDEGL